MRFQTFVTALTPDIEKAFLQISINPNDRDYLRVLWFENVFVEVPKIVRNRFLKVLFGMTSSTYLLNGTVQKHAKTYDFEFISKVLNCFYVDGLSGGENLFKKAFELYKKLKLRFTEGLFFLRIWRTNDEKLRHVIDKKDDEIHPCKILRILSNEKKRCTLF